MTPTYRPAMVRQWLDRIYGDLPGLLAVEHQDAGGRFRGGRGIFDDPEAVAAHIDGLEQQRAHSIYLRVTTLTERPPAGERGGAALSHALPLLWADIDVEGPGHKHDPARNDGRRLPPDSAAVRDIVAASGLPDPSLWVWSGGGAYPFWQLQPAHLITDDDRDQIGTLSALWQATIQRAAHTLGWAYGAGVGDLARVLRVPGTVNRKAGLERACYVAEDNGVTYTLAELANLPALTPPPPPPPAPAAAALPVPRPVVELWPGERGGPSAFDTLDQHVTFDDLLLGAGWTRCAQRSHPAAVDQCWTRPGDPEHTCSAHTLTARPEVLVVHSDAAGLPTGAGQKLTRGRVFAHLHHHGDERAAAVDIFAALAGRPSTPAAAALPLPQPSPAAPRPTPPTANTIGRADFVALETPHQEAGALDDEEQPDAPPPLIFRSLQQLRADVAARGPRRWLLRGVWPAGDYGVHAAEKKAQKTWNTVDLAVSVASGTPWLGHIPVDNPGPVLMFVGEGGDGNTLRRIDAIALEHGVDPDTLPIYVCTRAPHLNDEVHLAHFAHQVAKLKPALVTLDPLYLAARGAELGDLYKMGALLETPQRICQGHDAALFVVTHFNRQQGKGASRITGAGPAEWGRVLISASVKSRHTDSETRATRVLTELEIIGGEIPDQLLLVNRLIGSDDPDDLDAALHVTTTTTWAEDDTPQPDGVPTTQELPPAASKLLEAIDALGAGSQATLVDWISVKHGHGLRRETVSRELGKLEKAGLVESVELEPTGSRWGVKIWSRPAGHTTPRAVTPAVDLTKEDDVA